MGDVEFCGRCNEQGTASRYNYYYCWKKPETKVNGMSIGCMPFTAVQHIWNQAGIEGLEGMPGTQGEWLEYSTNSGSKSDISGLRFIDFHFHSHLCSSSTLEIELPNMDGSDT